MGMSKKSYEGKKQISDFRKKTEKGYEMHKKFVLNYDGRYIEKIKVKNISCMEIYIFFSVVVFYFLRMYWLFVTKPNYTQNESALTHV